jgi:hypothetical protein
LPGSRDSPELLLDEIDTCGTYPTDGVAHCTVTVIAAVACEFPALSTATA